MKYYISKTAKIEDALTKAVAIVWKDNRGLFENLMPIITYATLLWSPLSIVHTLLTAFGAHVLDISPAKIGAWLDEQAGTGPGETPSVDEIGDRLERSFSSALQEKTAHPISNRHLSKEANIFSAITRGVGLAKFLAAGLKKFISVILGVFGVMSIEGLLKEIAKIAREETGFEGAPKMIQEKMEEPDKSMVGIDYDKYEKPESTKNNLDSEIDRLQKKYQLQ